MQQKIIIGINLKCIARTTIQNEKLRARSLFLESYNQDIPNKAFALVLYVLDTTFYIVGCA